MTLKDINEQIIRDSKYHIHIRNGQVCFGVDGDWVVIPEANFHFDTKWDLVNKIAQFCYQLGKNQ